MRPYSRRRGIIRLGLRSPRPEPTLAYRRVSLQLKGDQMRVRHNKEGVLTLEVGPHVAPLLRLLCDKAPSLRLEAKNSEGKGTLVSIADLELDYQALNALNKVA